jgi:hypothetical protein
MTENDLEKIDGMVARREGLQILYEKIDRVKTDLGHRIECVEHKLDAVVADLSAHRADTEAHRKVYKIKED